MRPRAIEWHYTIAMHLPDGRIVGEENRIKEPPDLTRQELVRRIRRQALKNRNEPECDAVILGITIESNIMVPPTIPGIEYT